MGKIKILVCCHKQSKLRVEDFLMPIQVGKKNAFQLLNMQGDDSGENISGKNKNYCELTGLYWGWKNIVDADYIGLCHYRRYFNITTKEIEKCLSTKYKFIVAQHRSRPWSIADEIINQLTKEDYIILETVLKEKYPTSSQTIDSYFYGQNKYNPYNMFVCGKKELDAYCSWLFDILFETEKYVRLSEYSRLRRIFGYFGEYLLSLYIKLNHVSYKEIRVVNTDNSETLFKHYLRNLYFSMRFKFLRTRRHSNYLDVKQGLKSDGILINF